MRTLRTPAALAAVLAVLALVPTAAAGTGLELLDTGSTRFPDRSFVLTLPSERQLDSSQVTVRENDRTVSDFFVVPADEAGGRLGVVLVIDASLSMRGEPIEGAVEAARAFAEQRSPSQPFAIVTFNQEPTVLLRPTTDSAAIDAALASTPQLARATRIYDAVAAALGLLREAGITAGSIVVLSDGADTGSALAGSSITSRAQEAGVRIFSVGLRGQGFDPETLVGLADASGGEYAEATTTAGLTQLFESLGARLANQYLLRYRSHAGPKERVTVEVTVDGIAGLASHEYVSPALPKAPAEPFHRTFGETFWRSPAAALAVSIVSAFLLGIGLAALLRPRRPALRKRMAEFVSLAVPGEERRQSSLRTDKVLAGAERSLERTAWWVRFQEELEIARIAVPAVQIVGGTVVATLLAGWIAAGVGGSPFFAALGLLVPFAVRQVLKRRLERQRRLFGEQLPDNLQVLASALRAGHSLVGALSVVVDDSPEPSRAEFQRVIADEQLGVPLDEAFGVVVRRMANRDLEQVALVAALQRDTGGNTAEVLDRVTDTVRERFELRRMVKTLTAQGRMSRWIVTALPIGLLTFITAISPQYMRPLYEEPLGRVLLVVAGLMLIAGSLVIKKIVDIKV
jgi:tight adherence protein B